MLAVYRHLAHGEPKPDWLEAADLVEAFGVEAVFGRRALGVREMHAMLAARNLRWAYYSREAYRDEHGQPNWQAWAGAHPRENELLSGIERLAVEMEDG